MACIELTTLPVEITRVPDRMSDVSYVVAGVFSQMSGALNTFYREYMPDAIRTSSITNGMRVLDDRMADFLKRHVVGNADLQQLVRDNIALKHPDGVEPLGTGSGVSPG